jgi:predicted DNA binding CopG/RHH family protein
MPKKEGKNMNAREKQINLRLSAAEHDRLSREAALKGIGRAAYLRMLLLEQWRKEDGNESSRPR